MTPETTDFPSTTSREVRERIVEALRLDLVGPSQGHGLEDERLPGWVRPSNWYLTGFLIPSGTPSEQRGDLDADEDVEEIPERAGLAEESTEERKAARKSYFPSSMGLSFLAPPDSRQLSVSIRWGEYRKGQLDREGDDPLPIWERTQREALVPVGVEESPDPLHLAVPDSHGLRLVALIRTISGEERLGGIPPGTRSVSLFLVNDRAPVTPDAGEPDEAYVFQPVLEVRSDAPFVARPDPRGAMVDDWDARVADLHYRDTPEYAVGHGIATDWELVDNACRLVQTRWIPSAEVEKTKTARLEGVELSMDALGAINGGVGLRTALEPLVHRYRTWIQAQRDAVTSLDAARTETAEGVLHLAEVAADRIQRGIDVLAEDPDAIEAFRVANRAVARALEARLDLDNPPAWRAFQLAFILLNLPGLADPEDPGREIVDLLFFPTGGGKTEAYLGLAAFAMVLRRLRNPGDEGRGGAGVSVIMRYTLRLLTLDQLSRAAGLVCALELEREKDPARFGEWPFEIGLWVGRASTPNHMGRKGDGRSDTARTKVRQFKNDPRGKPSPIPLENCPWCGTGFEPHSFTLLPNDDTPKEMRIVCANFECDFTRDRPLPIVAVDEPLYRRLPAFLIATVDKFASLPWVGTSGALLGGAERFDGGGFYGPAESGGRPLSTPLLPPDLIIQDELHLISGPLGTMMGLYETAIEALCARGEAGARVRPKIVASTATVRQAQNQVQALFGRGMTQVFPPAGPDRLDSFFAQVVPADKVAGRLYLGIASKGRNPKVMMRRVWLALMGAAEQAFRDAGGHHNPKNPADPYMTVLGYFNSLRELGGARRILEEEVQNTVTGIGSDRRRIGEKRGLLQDRKTFSDVVELTSRVTTDKVAAARRRLEATFDQPDRVDYAIATNMISVGLDIPRLGLMVVLGQPKTHSEYIQATSRVGREDDRPGLVVTLLNVHKPRDRSHYERFRHYHETFYRAVEVPSVTPFSARALDRGFAGALVGLARHSFPEMTPPRGAGEVDTLRAGLEERLLEEFLARVDQQPLMDEDERDERRRSVHDRIVGLLDSWRRVVKDYEAVGVAVQYQPYELRTGKPLLRELLEENFENEHHRKFRANRSLRDVEPQVNLYIRDLSGDAVEGTE